METLTTTPNQENLNGYKSEIFRDYFSQRKYEKLPEEFQSLTPTEKRRIYVDKYYNNNRDKIISRKNELYYQDIEKNRSYNRECYHKNLDENRKRQRENYHYKRCTKEHLQMLVNFYP